MLDVTLADTDRTRALIANALRCFRVMNHEIEWIATFDPEFAASAAIRRMKLA